MFYLDAMIQVIAALGNPGPEYKKTRHNAGWLLIDAFAKDHEVDWKEEGKFCAQIGSIKVGKNKIWLIKPQTFMNLSGDTIGAFLRFHKLGPENILVIHDEVAFDKMTAKLTLGGSSGGHNGVADVIEKIGGQEFWRLRLGVGPRNGLLTLTEWVLGLLDDEEQRWLKSKELIHKVDLILDKGPAMAQNIWKLS